MPKIAFMGAGSTVFAKNILGDCMITPSLAESEIALYDIDPQRLNDSFVMLTALNRNLGEKAHIKKYCGVENRKKVLEGANYVVNAIQVGMYDPCTITDFEIPKKYGLRQTIGDTLGIGGIFRALRTIPVMMDFAKEMEDVCPDAWFLNYVNPMAILTGAMQRFTSIKTVGLCHSVQTCAWALMRNVGMLDQYDERVHWKIVGINHMAWLLEISRDGIDLYPEIKRRAALIEGKHKDMVRFELMKRLGYYVTESSEHNAEYSPFFIKSRYPELIDRYNIPLDEYPRRCIHGIERWKEQRKALTEDPNLIHTKSNEYASMILNAMETNTICEIGGNVINNGVITNLPRNACVEVPCMVSASGISPVMIGDLPEQLAAMNRSNINVQLLTIEAAMTRKKDAIYQAAMMDPHCQSELSIDDIVSMCDDLIEAHGNWLPKYH